MKKDFFNNDLHRIYSTSETEGDDQWYFVFNSEVPYCVHWQTVWKISGSHEPNALLGYQRWAMQNFVGQPSIQSGDQGSEGTDASYW